MNGKIPLSVIFSIIFGLIFISAIGGTAFYIGRQSVSPAPSPAPAPGGIACTMEAKLCPDGSAVGRTGPKCEFAPCPLVPGPTPSPLPVPSPTMSCTADSDCPSKDYTCEAIEGYGVVYPNESQPPAPMVITKGECKLKQGSACKTDAQCTSGLLCHDNACTSPIGAQCSGPGDASCSKGYTCIQSCGPPVSRENDPPPPYYCELDEYASRPKVCPICLASNSKIATPDGEMTVSDMKVGMPVWSVNKKGEKVKATVLLVSRAPVLATHMVVHVVLADGREAWVSPDHPLTNGLVARDLVAGDDYDGSRIVSAENVPYWDSATYDILPSGDTGYYWANGILFASTLSSDR
jgi:hypothetical protein